MEKYEIYARRLIDTRVTEVRGEGQCWGGLVVRKSRAVTVDDAT